MLFCLFLLHFYSCTPANYALSFFYTKFTRNFFETTKLTMKVNLMRNAIYILLLLLSGTWYMSSCSKSDKEIDITIKGLKNSDVILGYYFNNKMKPKDTIRIDSNGNGKIDTNTPLQQGVYFLYLPNGNHFDFLINNDQNFVIQTSANDLVLSQKITGNNESNIYLEYQKFITKKYLKLYKLIQNPNDLEETMTNNKIKRIINEINLRSNSIATTLPSSLIAKILSLSKYTYWFNRADLEYLFVPDDENQKQHFKEHYFDTFDFNDERLLYTPFFTPRLNYYFNKLISQQVDTLIKESNEIINTTQNNNVKKYLIKYFFNMAATNSISGIDAMIVNLAENYYFTGEAYWVDSAFVNKLRARVNQLKLSQVGQPAPDLMMKDYNERFYRLSENRAPLTILLFWTPTCGHCKYQIPQIKKSIWDKYQKYGIKIFAVYTQPDPAIWKRFIEDHDLYEWINVYDPQFKTNYWNLYNIHSTPSIFVLDKNKKIIYRDNGENVSIKKLADFIKRTLNN